MAKDPSEYKRVARSRKTGQIIPESLVHLSGEELIKRVKAHARKMKKRKGEI